MIEGAEDLSQPVALRPQFGIAEQLQLDPVTIFVAELIQMKIEQQRFPALLVVFPATRFCVAHPKPYSRPRPFERLAGAASYDPFPRSSFVAAR